MPALLKTIDPTGESIYFTDKFRQMLEDHLLILRNMSTASVRQMTDEDMNQIYRYTGDFYGFLTELGYSVKYHWTIVRMNGFGSRFDLTTDLVFLNLPDFQYVDKLAQLCKEKRA